MNSLKFRLALAGVLSTFLLIIVGSSAMAWTSFKSGNNGSVAAGQTVDSTLWVGANNVDIAGTVNGDLFCGGQTVNISGTVKGDVFCAAQTINVSGTIEGSARLAAQTIDFSGQVMRSASFAGQTISTDSKSSVAVDATIVGSELNLNGHIGRDLAGGGGNLNIGGQIERDAKIGANKVSLASDASIGGGIEYTSKNTISTASGSRIGGTITQHLPVARHHSWFRIAVFGGMFALIFSLMCLVSALVVTVLLPQMVYAVSKQGMRRPWVSLGIGALAGLVMPVLIVLLAITVVGIPLAILLGLTWLVINLSSGLFSAFWLGTKVWRDQRNPLFIILVGSLVLLVLYVIPYLGILAIVLATWLGQGMILLQLKSLYKKPVFDLKIKN